MEREKKRPRIRSRFLRRVSATPKELALVLDHFLLDRPEVAVAFFIAHVDPDRVAELHVITGLGLAEQLAVQVRDQRAVQLGVLPGLAELVRDQLAQ